MNVRACMIILMAVVSTGARAHDSLLTVTILPSMSSAASSPFDSNRGVAWQEQAADELAILHIQMDSGAVETIEDVRLPLLRELFLEARASGALEELRRSQPHLTELEVLVGTLQIEL